MSQLLRMVVAYTCLVLFMAFVALWVASYFCLISVSCRLNSDERVGVQSERGQLLWASHDRTPGDVIDLISWQVSSLEDIDRFRRRHIGMRQGQFWPREPSLIGFDARHVNSSFYVVTPHWFPILLIGAIGIIAKPRPKLKLGIRDLLILTTIVGIVMTIVVTSEGGMWPRG